MVVRPNDDSVPVLHVLRAPLVGGTELQLLALLRHLGPRFPSTVALLDERGPLLDAYRAQCPVWVGLGERPARLAGLVRFIARSRPKVIHTWLARVWGTAVAAAWGIPVVASFRGIDDGERPWRVALKRGFDRLTRARVPVVAAANSRAVAEFVPRFTGIPARHTVVIGNMLDRADLLVLPMDRAARPFVVGILARLEPIKDHATFLRAAALLARRVPDVRFVLAGSGSLRDALSAQARALGIGERCEFLGCVDDVQAVLARCHATVLCSRSEGLPNAIIESLAAGVPVVASNFSACREILVDGRSGFLVPAGDADALAERLAWLASHETLRLALGSRGRADVASSVDPRRIARRYERLYGTLARFSSRM
jgi:glycosyltransferase involved in cell wall biosynthesis